MKIANEFEMQGVPSPSGETMERQGSTVHSQERLNTPDGGSGGKNRSPGCLAPKTTPP